MSKNKNKNNGLSIVEIIIVIMLFLILIPTSLAIFIKARKLTGQSYIQNQASVTLAESVDILRYLRNLDYDQLVNGEFFLIRNTSSGSWLIKSDLPDMDIFERKIKIEDALRHTITNDLYFDGDTGASYEDPDTKKIIVSILWSPDYLPEDLLTHTFYLANLEQSIYY